MDIFIKAIPFFLLFILIEFIVSIVTQRKVYSLPDLVNNLSCGTLYTIFSLFTISLIGISYLFVYSQLAPYHLPPSILTWTIVFISVDFCYYWYHRASHRVAFLWATHVVHHQSEEFNLSVALRQSTIASLFSWVFYLPLAYLGFSPESFFISYFINFIYQFWIHTSLINKLGPLELIFNTPSHHRVHHGSNEPYIDKNYAGIFIIWDKLFGTFQAEEKEPQYGLIHPLRSWDPFWANVHAWVDIYNACKKTTSILDKIKIVFYPPGYMSNNDNTANQNREQHTRTKFHVHLNKRTQLYVLSHFIILNIISVIYYFHIDELSALENIAACFFIFTSIISFVAIFNEKKWTKLLEASRILYAATAIVYFIM